VRTLDALSKFVFVQNDYVMMSYTWKKPFSAPAFAFMFPLIRMILRGRGSLIGEGHRMAALQFVMAHSKLRSEPEMENSDEVYRYFVCR